MSDLIKEVLSKAALDAEIRHKAIGMTNMAGKTPEERVALDRIYEEAWDDMIKAKKALDAYLAR